MASKMTQQPMKHTIQDLIFSTLLYFLILCSCGSPKSDQNNKNDNTLMKKSMLGENLTTDTTIDKSKLLGVWWDSTDKDASHASFVINDSTIFYPDQVEQSQFKYEITNDSLVIYFDGFINYSRIDALTADRLELTTDEVKSTFIKLKK